MFPTEITTQYIISQSIGAVAIVLVLFSYFVNTKRKQLTLSILGNVCIAGSFLFLGTYVAFLGIVIATIRTIIFFIYEIRLKRVPIWIVSLIFLILITNSAIFMKSLLDLLPMFALMLFTLGFRIRRLVYMRLFFILPLILFLIYDFYIFAYTDVILKSLELAAVGLTSTRFFIRKGRLVKAKITEELQGEMEEINEH